jgi:hypothetical protein
MKIYKRKSEHIIRLAIIKHPENTEYLSLNETTLQEVEEYLKNLIGSQNLSPFLKGKKTMINIRESVDGKNGKGFNLSFRGMSPNEVFKLIETDLSKK